ncbi:magnesium transporter MgtE N-terminal domain-containing protein [Granulicella arctica]|uniref:magnesium transporter MgtE N-terminal domain-containing protein n=1 Tax=Granulicella arctica TaxID=940613 RepID=UPI0021E0AB99|nr:CBS domain-containing protein [Granulicella arctica]
MSKHVVNRTSVSTLMGTSVFDASGVLFGRVREFAVDSAADVHQVHALVVRRAAAKSGEAQVMVRVAEIQLGTDSRLTLGANAMPVEVPLPSDGGPGADTDGEAVYLLLERDLLDQQIIDINGHKVVRVNDVDLVWMPVCEAQPELMLRIAEVEVGIRGALRRLLKGLPVSTVDRLTRGFEPRVIPWEFVDLIERDPARRVKLKIGQDRLSRMHPSDIADILEELAPAERQALFNSLNDEVAADALEEVDAKMQQSLIESLDSEQIAGIVEEMDPGAAADLLAELSEERSDAILGEMDPAERQDVEELLEFESDSAAGRMTTEYIALGTEAAVVDAITALRSFEGDTDNVLDIFLIDEEGRITVVVPLVKLVLASGGDALKDLSDGHIVSCADDASGKKVAELFDKYNLRSLPVVDDQKRLIGVIHADQVIALLRGKH